MNGFYQTKQRQDLLESLQGDPRLRRCTFDLQPGNIQQAAGYLSSIQEPDLILVESGGGKSNLDDDLETLSASCSPDTRVILMGPDNDISLYKKLINLGLADYFSSDTSADQVLNAIEKIFLNVDTANQARVLAFIGANGGAGSSAIAANTAYCLAQTSQQPVTLVDLDLPFGTASLEFEIQSKQSVSDALAQPDRLDETLLERFMVSHSTNFSILPSVPNLASSEEVNPDALDALISLLRQMNSYVVFDLPRTWRPWIRDILLDCDEAIVVAQPELSGLRNAKNLMEHLLDIRAVNRPTRLVLNKEGARKKTELTYKDFENSIGAKPIANIPYDSALFGQALNNGKLVTADSRQHKVAKTIMSLATKVSGQEPSKENKGSSLLSFLHRERKAG